MVPNLNDDTVDAISLQHTMVTVDSEAVGRTIAGGDRGFGLSRAQGARGRETNRVRVFMRFILILTPLTIT